MRTIGITGGVGAGKTTILNYLEDKYKAVVLLADNIAHSLEEPGEPCYNELLGIFGPAILNNAGEIDPNAFGKVIFSDKAALEKVNAIIHPAVKKYILQRISEEKAKGTDYLVLEAALLLEDGYEDILDEIWYIHTDLDVRRKRLKESRGYSEEKIDSIINKQLSEAEFRSRTKYTIDNSGSAEDSHRAIDKILGEG